MCAFLRKMYVQVLNLKRSVLQNGILTVTEIQGKHSDIPVVAPKS